MTTKSIINFVLFIFVGVSVVYLVIQESTSAPVDRKNSEQPDAAELVTDASSNPIPEQKELKPQNNHKLVAYYFHRTQRCQTCLTMEAYTIDALKNAFPEALKTGKLEFRTVNLDEPANEHFVTDYELASSGLVLADHHNGQQREWRNLQRIWELVMDETKFKDYVESEATPLLEDHS